MLSKDKRALREEGLKGAIIFGKEMGHGGKEDYHGGSLLGESLRERTEKEPFTLIQSTIMSRASVGYSTPTQPAYVHKLGRGMVLR